MKTLVKFQGRKLQGTTLTVKAKSFKTRLSAKSKAKKESLSKKEWKSLLADGEVYYTGVIRNVKVAGFNVVNQDFSADSNAESMELYYSEKKAGNPVLAKIAEHYQTVNCIVVFTNEEREILKKDKQAEVIIDLSQGQFGENVLQLSNGSYERIFDDEIIQDGADISGAMILGSLDVINSNAVDIAEKAIASAKAMAASNESFDDASNLVAKVTKGINLAALGFDVLDLIEIAMEQGSLALMKTIKQARLDVRKKQMEARKAKANADAMSGGNADDANGSN